MKKILLSIGLIASGFANAQFNTVANGGFEFWLTTSLGENLDQWSSSNSMAPGTLTKTNDSQDQNYAIKIETLNTGTDTTFGYCSFGDVGNSAGAPYSDPVDSLIFYAKYDIMPGDTALALVIQYTPSGEVMNIKQLSGSNTSSYQRLAMNLQSATQDSILVAFASSNAFVSDGIPGSWLQIDNVSFNHSSSTPSSIPNYSFEDWSNLSISEAEHWYSANNYLLLMGQTPNAVETTDAYAGSKALQLTTVNSSQGVIPGILSNVELGSGNGVPYTASPTNFSGAYKYNYVTPDTATIMAVFYGNGGNYIGMSIVQEMNIQSSYVTFNETVLLSAQPDSMSVSIIAGNYAGSEIIVDDLALTGGNVNVFENPFANMKMYPNPTENGTWITLDNYEGTTYSIFSQEGKLVESANVTSNNFYVNTENLSTGIYLVKINSSLGATTQKLIVK